MFAPAVVTLSRWPRHSELREVVFPAEFWEKIGKVADHLQFYVYVSLMKITYHIHIYIYTYMCKNDMIINPARYPLIFSQNWQHLQVVMPIQRRQTWTLRPSASLDAMRGSRWLARLQLLRFQVDRSLQALAQAVKLWFLKANKYTPLKINILNPKSRGLVQMIFFFKQVIFRFHVNFLGCTLVFITSHRLWSFFRSNLQHVSY